MGSTNRARKRKPDPLSIPRLKLYTGDAITAIGLGTFGSDPIRSVRRRLPRLFETLRTSGIGILTVHRCMETSLKSAKRLMRSLIKGLSARIYGLCPGIASALSAAGAFQFVVDRGIQPVGYCLIGSPGGPERDRTPDDTAPTEYPVVMEIARRHQIDPAVLCIKWAMQRGQIPIQFSIHHERANLEGGLSDPLSEEEMQEIAAIDRNCRLIKGQVFLWKTEQSWEDLWDIDGGITAA
jgi:hypothetical protein